MPSITLFLVGTLLLSLNSIRFAGLAISDWFYFGALGLAVIETAHFDRKNFTCWTRNRFLWPAGLILFGAIISTARAVFVQTAVIEIVQQLFVITLFISLIWVMVKRGKARVIMRAFILSGVLAASVAIVDFFAGTRFGPILSGTPGVQFWGRYAGTLGHPNKFGYFLVITSILSLAELMDDQSKRSPFITRLFWGFLFSLQIFGLYLSGSVAAYLGILLGLVALFLSSRLFLRRTLKFMIPILYALTLVFVFVMIFGTNTLANPTVFGSSLITRGIGRVESTTARSRWVIYIEALEQIVNNPLVGVGYDQISTSGIGFDNRELSGTVHNLLLQIWYVGGLFAFLGWLVIYFSIGWEAISVLHWGERRAMTPIILGIAAAVVAVLLMDLFQDAIYQREKWLVVGLLVTTAWSSRSLK